MAHGKSAYNTPFEVFFDGDCPLCLREINMIRKLDRQSLVIYTDIAESNFNPMAATGLTYEVLMARIHGRLSTGELIEGVEVFRQLYARTFLKPLVPLTRIPGIVQLLNLGYRGFAWLRFRSRGGRCDPDGTCRIERKDQAQKA